MRIAVAGGTGAVGRHLVALAAQAGHDVAVLARSSGVDLSTGEGLAGAVQGADVLVDVFGPATAGRRAVGAFEQATVRLLSAGQQAGVTHHLVLSVVGCDRVPSGYYRGKVRQEQLVLAGPVPATVLRATQFHEFPGQLLARVPGPVVPLPVMRVQPVAAREVAEHLLGLATGPPRGRVPDLAGPEQHLLADLARRVLRARGSRRRVLSVRPPGAVGRELAAGGVLPQGDGPRGSTTFAQWLAGEARGAAS
jgi:uncharacterized protein YbjT (DUF2867 family)